MTIPPNDGPERDAAAHAMCLRVAEAMGPPSTDAFVVLLQYATLNLVVRCGAEATEALQKGALVAGKAALAVGAFDEAPKVSRH